MASAVPNCRADDDVAVRVTGKGEGRRQKVKTEMELWSAVGAHPNIVELRGSFVDAECVFFVKERCTSTILDLVHGGSSGARGHAPRLLLAQMLLGVRACHQAMVVHRGIHPRSFLWNESSACVKLGDFSLAARVPREGGGLRGQVGSPPMMSPEMLECKEYGTGTDVWSFAVAAYFITYEELPYSPKKMTASAAKRAVLKGEPPRMIRRATQLYDKTEGAFLAFLLQREQGLRASADEALEHPFLRAGVGSESQANIRYKSEGSLRRPKSAEEAFEHPRSRVGYESEGQTNVRYKSEGSLGRLNRYQSEGPLARRGSGRLQDDDLTTESAMMSEASTRASSFARTVSHD